MAPGMERRLVVGLAALVVLTSGLGLGYRWLTATTPVSTHEALHRFRQQQSRDFRSTDERAAKPASGGQLPAAPTTRGGGKAQASPAAATPGPRAPLLRPDPGVYTWRTVGFEEAMGIRRDFPPQSQRIVTLGHDQTYKYRHLYSEEHEQWFEGQATHTRIVVPHVRERVAFGPFDAEIEVNFDPAMVFATLPLVVDRTWKGEWSGDTYGDYAAHVFERTRMAVGGSDVEVWGVELHIEMHGEVEGEQDLRAWIAPAHRTTVREEYVVTGRLRGEPGTYHGEWTISLLSPKPQG